MKHFILSKRSRDNLNGVKPEIIAVVFLALKYSEVDFVVIDGVRTVTEQQKYFDKGISKTLGSMHLIQEDGFSHAVDIIPAGFITFNDITDEAWQHVNEAMKKASDVLGYDVYNGFDMWGWDKPHWQDRR